VQIPVQNDNSSQSKMFVEINEQMFSYVCILHGLYFPRKMKIRKIL